jgi:hypothetical protein
VAEGIKVWRYAQSGYIQGPLPSPKVSHIQVETSAPREWVKMAYIEELLAHRISLSEMLLSGFMNINLSVKV